MLLLENVISLLIILIITGWKVDCFWLLILEILYTQFLHSTLFPDNLVNGEAFWGIFALEQSLRWYYDIPEIFRVRYNLEPEITVDKSVWPLGFSIN